jgi:hypothetical protein
MFFAKSNPIVVIFISNSLLFLNGGLNLHFGPFEAGDKVEWVHTIIPLGKATGAIRHASPFEHISNPQCGHFYNVPGQSEPSV